MDEPDPSPLERDQQLPGLAIPCQDVKTVYREDLMLCRMLFWPMTTP
jgi:hypothetical protein